MYNFKSDAASLRLTFKELLLRNIPVFLEYGINLGNLDYILSLIQDKIVLNELIILVRERFTKLPYNKRININNLNRYIYNGDLNSNSDVADSLMENSFRTASDNDMQILIILFRFLSNEYERIKYLRWNNE